MAAAKKQWLFAISVLHCMTVFTSLILSPRFRNDYKFGISVIAHHFVIYWLFQNGVNKNQHQESYQRETMPDKFVFFFKIGKAK